MIITIGRQTGSGGHEIAKKLAEALDLKFFDKEILNIAAEDSGYDRRFFEKNDEKHGFFRNIVGTSVTTGAMGFFGGNYNNGFSQEKLFILQSNAIKKAAQEGNCLFVGRCADYVLRDCADVINIFITAPLEDRVARLMKRHNCSAEQAEKHIREKQDTRASFYNYYSGKKWGNAASYDICINSSLLGIDGTVEYIKNLILNTARNS